MADRLRTLGLRRSWPKGEVDLLLRAIIAPREDALHAWREWTRTRNFDDVNWAEIRLLGPLSLRLADLDPDSPLRPRVTGLARRFWTKTQLRLQAAGEVFDALSRHGIPFLLFKGAATYAEGYAPASRRIMGDVDLLVRRERIEEAVETLTGAGWESVNGESAEYLRYLSLIRLSGNYRKGTDGDVDLHSELFHYERRDPVADECLWASARQHRIGSRPVLVPDPTDSVLIALAHAAVGKSGDWAVDVTARLAAQTIDWERLVETAARRGLSSSCLAGLLYLRELEVAVPDQAVSRLARARRGFAERLKHWSNVRDRADRNVVEKMANAAANATLRKRGFSYFLKDTRAVSVKRPGLPLGWLLGRGRRIAADDTAWRERHDVGIDVSRLADRLVLSVTIRRPRMRRRFFFDVLLDGRPVARLRGRSRGYRPGSERRILFGFPVPSFDRAKLSVVARPAGYAEPDADPARRESIAPLEFRLHAVWLL